MHVHVWVWVLPAGACFCSGVIIWGSEGGSPAGRKQLLQWFKNHSAVFGSVGNSSDACTEALAIICPNNIRTAAGVLRCDACAGLNQERLRAANCSASEVQSWCAAAKQHQYNDFRGSSAAAGDGHNRSDTTNLGLVRA